MTAKVQKVELNQHHDELLKMEGLLMKMEAQLSESEMAVTLLREEVKGRSNVVDLTGEEDKENEVDTLGSPYVLTLSSMSITTPNIYHHIPPLHYHLPHS